MDIHVVINTDHLRLWTNQAGRGKLRPSDSRRRTNEVSQRRDQEPEDGCLLCGRALRDPSKKPQRPPSRSNQSDKEDGCLICGRHIPSILSEHHPAEEKYDQGTDDDDRAQTDSSSDALKPESNIRNKTSHFPHQDTDSPSDDESTLGNERSVSWSDRDKTSKSKPSFADDMSTKPKSIRSRDSSLNETEINDTPLPTRDSSSGDRYALAKIESEPEEGSSSPPMSESYDNQDEPSNETTTDTFNENDVNDSDRESKEIVRFMQRKDVVVVEDEQRNTKTTKSKILAFFSRVRVSRKKKNFRPSGIFE